MSSRDIETLRICFAAMERRDKERLKKHLLAKTPIFCGPGASSFFSNEEGHV